MQRVTPRRVRSEGAVAKPGWDSVERQEILSLSSSG